MAIISFPYDSQLVDGVYDRAIKSATYRQLLSKYFTTGVFPNPSTQCQVYPSTGMKVSVRKGSANINGLYVELEEDVEVTIEQADTQGRYDRIVLRHDDNNNVRATNVVVIKGTAGASPQAPSLTRNETVYDICLATVYVRAGATSISASDITDTRLNKDLCGIVSATIESIDTTTLYNQIQSDLLEFKTKEQADFEEFSNTQEQAFLDWFEGIKGILGEDEAGNLLNLVQENQANIEKLQYTGNIVGGETFSGKASNKGIKLHKVVGKTISEKNVEIKKINSATNQLLDASKIATKTQGGATVTNNDDGSLTVSGSGTLSEKYISDGGFVDLPFKLKTGKLYLTQDIITNPFTYVDFADENGSYLTTIKLSEDTNKAELNISSDSVQKIKKYKLAFVGYANQQIKTGTVKPMLYQDGDGTWEPFKHSTIETSLTLAEGDIYEDGIITRADGTTEILNIPTIPSYYPNTNVWTDNTVSTDIEWEVLAEADNSLEIEEVKGNLQKPNLLINADFRNSVINQQGSSEYASPNLAKFNLTVDMWLAGQFGKVTVNNGYLSFQANGGSPYFKQNIYANVEGEAICFTVKLKDQGIVSKSTSNLQKGQKLYVINDADKEIYLELNSSGQLTAVLFLKKSGVTVNVEYMKLEYGAKFTGMPIWTYNNEIEKCQNFLQIYGYKILKKFSTNQYEGFYFRKQMSKVPSVLYSKITRLDGSTAVEGDFDTLQVGGFRKFVADSIDDDYVMVNEVRFDSNSY